MYNKKRALKSIIFLLILFYLGFLTTHGGDAEIPAMPSSQYQSSQVNTKILAMPVSPYQSPQIEAKITATPGYQRPGPQVPEFLLSKPDARKTSLAEPEAEEPEIQSPVEVFFEKYEGNNYTQFGYKIFQTTSSSRIPVVGPEYLLGPGDEISIKVWGQALLQLRSANEKNSSLLEHNLIVDQKGHLLLPELGPISISGLSLGNLEGILTVKYQELYKDCLVAIALTNSRKIEVLVSGQVENPGYVSVHAGSTVYDALLAAGGITKMGSLRNVMLRQADNQTQQIDFYRLIVSRDEVRLPQLREKDILLVPDIGPTVLIKGEVRRPGIYEILKDENLNDLVRYAGDAFPNIDYSHIEITRFDAVGGRLLVHVEGLNAEIVFKDGDAVTLRPIKDDFKNYVCLTGHVYRPMAFSWRKNLSLKNILTSYDQMQPEAALDYGEIERHQGTDLHPAILIFHPQRLLEGDEDENISLQPRDTIRIYSKWELEEKPMVEVCGAVQKPGKYLWVENLTLSGLIRKAGGLLKKAEDKVHIVRYQYQDKNWKISSHYASLAEVEKNSDKDQPLMPLDRVVIRARRDFNQTEWRVSIQGAVNFPGDFPIGKDTRLADVLKEAGGLIPEAYLPGLVLIRPNAWEVQTAYRQVAVELLKKDLVWQSAESAQKYLSEEEKHERKQAVAIIQSYLSHIESQAPEGRIVLASDNLVSLEKFEQSCCNVPLQDGDRIFVPTTPDFISIVGEIYRPSSYLFQPKKKLADYLALAGGISPYADLSASFLVRSSGEIMSYQQKQKHFLQIVMEPGDVVVLPSKVLRIQRGI